MKRKAWKLQTSEGRSVTFFADSRSEAECRCLKMASDMVFCFDNGAPLRRGQRLQKFDVKCIGFKEAV